MEESAEHCERFQSLDEILGDPGQRYFGTGYRHVEQRVLDVHIDTATHSATARGQVIYPASWSVKKNRELIPHLSTIDGFVIAVQLLEAYAREAFGLDDRTTRACWLRHCCVRAGPTPTLELNSIPVSLTMTESRPDSTAMGGFLSTFRVKVGVLALDLTLDHPLFVERNVCIALSDVDASLGSPQLRYYGGGYKSTQVQVSDVVLDRSAARARARFHLDFAEGHSHTGLSGEYVPFISIVDALIGTAQLAQAVLYGQDRVNRASSGNMWMRRVSVDVPRPLAPAQAFDVETWIRHASVVPVGDRRWRTAKFDVVVPSLHSAEYCVAHELPGAGVAEEES